MNMQNQIRLMILLFFYFQDSFFLFEIHPNITGYVKFIL